MYQSAFWAGFMTDCLHAKQPHHDHLRRASFDNPCSPILPLTMYSAARLEGTMLITNVRAHHIRIPYDAGVASFTQGASSIAALEIVMVEVSTDAGITGRG